MMKYLMRHRIAVTFIPLIILVFSAANALAADPEYIIRMATIAPDESYWGDFARKVKFYVENRTRGRVKMIWYTSGVMGDEPVIVEKIKSGDLQGAVLTITGFGNIQPALRALTLPMLFENFHEVDHIIDTMFPTFRNLMARKGFALLSLTEVGFGWIFTTRPITGPNDLAGMKMWTWEGMDLVEAYLRDMGFINLTPTPVPDCKCTLEKGITDAFFSTCYVQPFLEWYRHVNYISSFWVGYSPAAVVMDLKYFKNLPSDIRYPILQAFDMLSKPLREIIRKEEETARNGLLKRGIKEYPTPPKAVQQLKQRAYDTYFRYADKQYPHELIIEILTKLKDFRARQKVGKK